MTKRTKIVCTIGPSSSSVKTLSSMMQAGMDVARQNFSHGTHVGHRALYRLIRKVAKQNNKHVAIIGDLQGPKIRLGELPQEGVVLKSGQEVMFVFGSAYDENVIPVTYDALSKDVKVGERMLIDDGLIETEVVGKQGKKLVVRVINGGHVSSHKGLNFPDSKLSISSITDKDKQDVAFMVPLGVDWVVLSFVTDPSDARVLRRLIKKVAKPGQVLPRIMAKIEKKEAVERFDEILEVVDGVMIGRGDLGVEVPAEEVPIYQKELIEKCRQAGKPVIVATQMLESMRENPRPTRAEVSDVANAVFDHADAIMLSAESATGSYPIESVRMMSKIAHEAEISPYDDVPTSGIASEDRLNALSESLKLGHLQREIDAVLVSVELAPWAVSIFRSHPEMPFFVASPDDATANQVRL
jgi:pyruvate kinase